MAADEQVPLSLPDTQNADILTPATQPQTQEIHSQKTQRVWGKLYPNDDKFKMIELTKNEYTLGRSVQCDICLTEEEMNKKRWSVVSKQHFRITREVPNDGLDEDVVFLQDDSHNGTFVNKTRVGRGNRVILENNDSIALAQPQISVYTYMSTRGSESSGLPPELKRKYAVSSTLGSGACGEVKKILSKIGCEKFALKTIVKNRFLSTFNRDPFHDPDKIFNEVRILKELKHPCIIKMKEIYDTPSSVYIVLELMEGGELFDRIRETPYGLSEKNAKIIFYQVVLAVHYLHEMGIAHRDLKPENILLASNAELTLVKVSDFGLSKLVDTQTMMRTFCGTPMYVAPEVLLTHGKGSYTNQVDVWSLGVILYCCLSGLVPFSNNNKDMPLQQQIVEGAYRFPNARFGMVSKPAIDLIKRMLTVNPNKRITIKEVLLHDWLRDSEMRTIVSKLMEQENISDENTAPAPSTSRQSTSRESASRVVASVRRRMEPTIAAFKRARVE